MSFSRQTFVFSIMFFLFTFMSACGKGTLDDANDLISPIDQITIPDDVQVIGLGEATHGNIEFQKLKKDVFQALMEHANVRVFVLEGDFGGGQQINDFILNGNGSAKDAVEALDYGIYRTKEMIDLIQWMHDYNETANEEEKIYFYGNDMQRYDYNKAGLLDYYSIVNEEAAESFSLKLEHVTNESMHDFTEDELKEIDKIVDSIIADLQANEDSYVEHSSQEEFIFALQYAEIMKQRTDLLMNEDSYARIRDKYLAENLEWIVEFETARGHNKLFVSAHNGHIEKTSAAFGYESMGDYLDDIYGERYFAIGTDFLESTFQAYNSGKNERKIYTVKNRNKLVRAFEDFDPNIFYIDFKKADESEDLREIITSKQRMPNIGDDFRAWYKFIKFFYTIKMTPDEAYDGIIIVKEATPTSVLN